MLRLVVTLFALYSDLNNLFCIRRDIGGSSESDSGGTHGGLNFWRQFAQIRHASILTRIPELDPEDMEESVEETEAPTQQFSEYGTSECPDEFVDEETAEDMIVDPISD